MLVLGSSNVDLILKIPRFHHSGETIKGDNLVTVFGGKGANQAIASKRLGGKVIFMTKLGDEAYGRSYYRYLLRQGFHPDYLLKDKKLPTGIALIELAPNGENRIIVSPGANGSLSAKDLEKLSPLWKQIKILVTQFEIPITTVKMGLKMAKENGAITLVNPSPAYPIPPSILSMVDFIVPNEWEAQSLTGIKWRGGCEIRKMAENLLEKGARNVVVTLGSKGLFFKNRIEEFWMKAFKVNAIDTTAAGDAFLGAFAYCLAQDKPIHESLTFANAAGALATTKLGAQPSLPSKKEVQLFLSKIKSS